MVSFPDQVEYATLFFNVLLNFCWMVNNMILTGNEDLRVQKTIESINQTFEEMLIEMDYSKITVKELTNRAKINKKTFYRYYECIDDLLAEKQEMITTECLQNLAGYKIPDELDKII